MSYAIICDARKGRNLDIEVLAYIDRTKTKRSWWTSDAHYLIMKFRKRSAADYSCNKLRKNDPRVINYKTAVKLINEQDNHITHMEANAASVEGWDGHKDSF